MPSPPNQRHYPIECPICGEVKGYPYQVQTVSGGSGSIEVRLRCRDCSHEWTELVASNE
jgi:DNA-directed RNA polymerase subunit M/transcription elongation factor TFIIS